MPDPALGESSFESLHSFFGFSRSAYEKTGQRLHAGKVSQAGVVNCASSERQEWFLKRLRAGDKVRREDLLSRFGVAPITAKRDIAALKTRGAIEYEGSKKTGFYRLKKDRER